MSSILAGDLRGFEVEHNVTITGTRPSNVLVTFITERGKVLVAHLLPVDCESVNVSSLASKLTSPGVHHVVAVGSCGTVGVAVSFDCHFDGRQAMVKQRGRTIALEGPSELTSVTFTSAQDVVLVGGSVGFLISRGMLVRTGLAFLSVLSLNNSRQCAYRQWGRDHSAVIKIMPMRNGILLSTFVMTLCADLSTFAVVSSFGRLVAISDPQRQRTDWTIDQVHLSFGSCNCSRDSCEFPDPEPGFSLAQLVGIVCGAVALCCGCCVIAIRWWRKRNRASPPSPTLTASSSMTALTSKE